MHRIHPTFIATVLWLFFVAFVFGNEFSGEIHFAIEDVDHQTAGGYDFLRLPDGKFSGEVGAPALPMIERDLPIPWDAEGLHLSVLGTEITPLEGTFHIPPLTQPRIVSGPEPEEDPFIEDPLIYERDEAYPGIQAETLTTWDLVGRRMVKIGFHPLQYNPRTGRVSLATSIRFRITWNVAPNATIAPTFNLTAQGRDYYEKALNKRALAPVSVASFTGSTSRALPAGQYDHVIITPQAFETAWEDLREWRTLRGQPSTIVTKDYITSNYSGSTTKAKIRNFIIDAHATWGTRYFLLGADGGTGTNEIPYHTVNILSEDIANDTYYADYDNDWVAEVQVGRATVTNTTQIGQFLDKVFTYEKTPPSTNYGKKVLFLGFDLDGDTPGEDTKEIIVSDDLPGYITLQTEYDSESGSHLNDVIGYMNGGPNLLNHIDHCNWNIWGMGYTNHGGLMDDSDVDALSNGPAYINFYTLGCFANAWDNSQSISENIMREVGDGCVSFTGNTRYGWYAPGYPDLCSSLYDILWWHVLFTDNQYHVGDTLSAHKNDHLPYDEYDEFVFTELSLLGDPAMPLWLDDPTALTVTCDDPVSTGSQTYDVNVKDGVTNLSGAMVCLFKNGEVYAFDTTDTQGDCSLNIAPSTTGDMHLTVTAQDFLPYEDLLTVTESAPPEVTSVSPTDGGTAGGTACTIDGFYFTTTPDTSVTFGGATATSVAVVDANTITCTAPAHAAGSVDLQVTNSNGSDTLTDGFTYHAAPTVSSAAPDNGPVAGGTAVTVSGTGFTTLGSTTVTFGGVNATGVVIVDGTTLTCNTPAHNAGLVSVVVSNDFGSDTLPNAFTYNAPPVVSGVDPAAGPVAGGTTVTITGQAFTTTPDTDVYFDGAAAMNITVVDAYTLTCTTPAHSTGFVDVEVSNGNGSDTLSNGFEYCNPPNITSVTPDTGPTAGNSAVTISGTGFDPTLLSVNFDGIDAANIVILSDTTLTCTTPAHAAGAVDVEISNLFGSDTLADGYTYQDAPSLSSLYPTEGPAAGGTTVTLTGQNFDGTGSMDIYFGGTLATGVTIINGITMTCTTPAHAAGSVDVQITNALGGDTLPNGFTYKNEPVISGIAPTDGPAAGGTSVTISGLYFTTSADTTVTFDGTPATNVVVVSNSLITCDTPAHVAGDVDVEVINSNGSDGMPACFCYHNAPAIASVAPLIGILQGGSTLTVTGSDFTTVGATSVLMDGIPATNVTVENGTTITCTLPPYPVPDTVDIEVINDFGSDVLPDGFLYLPKNGLPPQNLIDVDPLDLDPGDTVRLATTGKPGALYMIFFSNGGGPVNTKWGSMGLDMPVYYMFSWVLNNAGYHTITLEIPSNSGGYFNFYTHTLVDDDPPVWAVGGNNPNGSGSIMWGIN